ncbi:MAG TPA: DMT family transporter [Humidesulfovibrio sp.]|uniref:DMT family transporter n=1 Tax=Humidesulfovibrio sp. TaxID=2910988 RepID=UPI002B82694C|nr:DMT family transporter [Humidesulfovibrio sp.]HWR02545.1 DMT family transporter [Humidesulfovibrio sp.]
MSLLALWLVLASAALHVFWNTLVKQCPDKLSFAWLTTVAGNLVLAPAFVLWRPFSTGSLGPEVWLWAAVSGALETVYIACLFGAYAAADLSAVYPLSRGAAPVFTLLLAGVLVGDGATPMQAAGVAVVVAGTLLVGVSAWRGGGAPLVSRRGLCLSLATGCAIAGYHLADRKAMSLAPGPDPLDYLFLMHLFMSLFVTLWAWRKRPGWTKLAASWLETSCRNGRRDVILVAVFTPLSYFLIVLALREGNVIHVTAARNVGILFSTLAGALVLRERVTPARAFGSALIVAGLAGMALLQG